MFPIKKVLNDFNINFKYFINQLPGFFLWKDVNSHYIMGSESTARLFGFKNSEELIGITDLDIRCPAAEYADLFIKQDKKVLEELNSIVVLDIHPYVNGELKTLLINKSLLIDENNTVTGVGCHCIEVNSSVLSEIFAFASKIDLLPKKHSNKKATNYYLNSHYPNLNLTSRQSECLFYLIRGKSYKEIARVLQLSPRTIEEYVHDIKDKMGCYHKTEIVDKAIEKGFVEIIPAGIISNKITTLLKF